jgi:hypothetical protein
MAITTYSGTGSGSRQVLRHTDASGANAIGTLTSPVGQDVRLLFVAVRYSAAPTQAGVTITLDSGAGAAYDTVLLTGSANAQNTVLIPAQEMILADTDAILVTAPAGGGVITSQMSIYTEPVF